MKKTDNYLDEAIRLLELAKIGNTRGHISRAIRCLISYLVGKKLTVGITEITARACVKCHKRRSTENSDLCTKCDPVATTARSTDLARRWSVDKGLLGSTSRVNMTNDENHEQRILAHQARIEAELKSISDKQKETRKDIYI